MSNLKSQTQNAQPTICLTMIVKNESKVMERCLKSVLPIIDRYCIVDTGSTDDTEEIIRKFFKENNIEGKIYDHPFVDFEDARNYALTKAKKMSDFCFTIDADEILMIEEGFSLTQLKTSLSQADVGLIAMRSGTLSYARKAFWRNDKPFRYKYPVHELLLCDMPTINISVDGLYVDRINDGNSWSVGQEKKYLGNVALLQNYLHKNGIDPRCIFYLAESYKDAGNLQKAIDYYEKRTTITNGFNEEIYYSRLMVGKLKWQLGYPIMEIADEFMRCGEWDTLRAEHLYELKLMYEKNNRPQGALKMAELLSKYKNPYPDRLLFLNPDAYVDSKEEKIIDMRKEPYLINGLNTLIQTIKDSGGDTSEMTMIEIGSYAGESTVMFAKHFKKVIAVDCWQDGYDDLDLASHSAPMSKVEKIFDFRIKGFNNIQKVKNKSDDAIKYFIENSEKEPINFVYIDGMHTYDQVKNDICNYIPLLKAGDFIGGHDFSDGWTGVKKAVIDALTVPEWTFEDTSWMFKIRDGASIPHHLK